MTRFTIVGLVSEQVVAEFAGITRLSGGPRLVDSSTCISYSLDAQLPGNITDSWFTPSDLSTIYCVFDQTPTASGNGNPIEFVDCVNQAYKDNAKDLKNCDDAYNNALIDYMEAYVAALVGCALAGPGAPACIAIFSAALAAATATALVRLYGCNNDAKEALKNRLLACNSRMNGT